MEAFDPSTATWRKCSALPTARDGHGVAAWNGRLFAAGGWDSHYEPVLSVEVFTPETDTWHTMEAAMPHPCTGAKLVVFDDALVCIGDQGYGEEGYQRYDRETEARTAHALPVALPARDMFAVAAIEV